MLQDELGVRAALSTPPFAAFCEFKTDEPPRRGSLAALCGSGEAVQRQMQRPAFEMHYRSRYHPHLPAIVEPYGRSAAGVVVEPAHLRTPVALEKSMHFLVHHYLREPHTPAVFLAPFDVWRYLWDRMRQVRTNWVPQLPPVGTESLGDDNADGEQQRKESRRRLRWLEFTVAALAVGGANLCRSVQGCRLYMAEKQNFLESIAQCFSDLIVSYRAEQRLRNSEMMSAVILFYGLSQLSKIENRAGFCRTIQMMTSDAAAEGSGGAVPTHVFEPSSSSVDFGSVYRELAFFPRMARTHHVRKALKFIHCWCQREWFRFFFLCRTERLTVLQRAILFQSFSYARFRAVLDLVTANVVVYNKVRLRGEMPIAELADLLLMEDAHCVELLETMGLGAQLRDNRSVLCVARHDSSPYTTQEAIYRHLEDTTGKPRLCLPTLPSFFGFTVWERAFELFPDAFSNDDVVTDLHSMICPVNIMQLLEPYCPPYNDDVAALELTDAGGEWFDGLQEARERMLLWHVSHTQHRRLSNDDDNDMDDEDRNGTASWSDESCDEETQELRRAAVAALDRESQSTHSSIFDDHNSYNEQAGNNSNRSTNDYGDENEDRSNSGEEGEEENDVLRSAKELLQSLQENTMYARMRKEMREKMNSESSPAVLPVETACDAPAPCGDGDDKESSGSSSSLKEEKSGQQQQEQEQERQWLVPSPWLCLPPTGPKVEVTPLPSDYPGEMSPSLRATVETPKSVTTVAVEDVEVVPPQGDDAKTEREKSLRDLPLCTRKATSVEVAGSRPVFGSFPRMPVSVVQQPRKQHEGGREDSNDSGRAGAKRTRSESTTSNSVLPSPAFPELAQQQNSLETSFNESVINRVVHLPFEQSQTNTEVRQQQQQQGHTEDEASETPQLRRMRVEPEEEQQQQSAQQSHVMRKVTFTVSPSTAPLTPPQRCTVSVPEEALGSWRTGSYQGTVRTYLQKKKKKKERERDACFRSGDLCPIDRALPQQQQQPPVSPYSFDVNKSSPQWMSAFTKYLVRFFTASRGDVVARRCLFEVLSGDPTTQARGIAGWLCRGFNPRMASYYQGQRQRSAATNVVGEMAVLRLSSTVVVFGSHMRGTYDKDEEGDATCHPVGCSVVHETLKSVTSLAPVLYGDADAAEASMTWWMKLPFSLGRWVAAVLLGGQDGAHLLSHGVTSDVMEQDDEYEGEGDDNKSAAMDDGEQLGVWEQLHSVRMTGVGSVGQWSQSEAAWERPSMKEGLLWTRLELYGVDYRDASRLRWAAVNCAETPQLSHSPLEHITAIVTLNFMRREEYEEGLDALRLLVRQAAEQRVVVLSGVLVVLYTSSAEEDKCLQQEVEEFFWEAWRQSAEAAASATACRKTTEETPSWRAAYQSTMRSSVGADRHQMQAFSAAHGSSETRQPPANQSSITLGALRGFFRNTRGGRKEELFGAPLPSAPSPVLVVLPIRSAVNGKRGNFRSSFCNKEERRSGFTEDIKAESLRVVLMQAIESLLHGYDAKWKEFLYENETAAQECVRRHITPPFV